MHIVHVTSEFAPIVKAGGLGDVVHGLSKAQVKAGHRVDVILPKYDILNYQYIHQFHLELPDLFSYEDQLEYHNSVYAAMVDSIPLHFIEPHHNHYYFNRGSIYGCLNDIERFLYFCRATLEYLMAQEIAFDIIHLHDWPTAALAPLIKTLCNDTPLANARLIFTIHNIEHQGKCRPHDLNRIGLHGLDFRCENQMQDPIDPSLINLLKGAIVNCDQVVTVSPTYAHEITSSQLSFGLTPTIQTHKKKITGILNGIDLNSWNPATDAHISYNYPTNPTYLEEILTKKKQNRAELLQALNLKPTSGPLIACISRLAQQKGPRLIQKALHYTLEKGGTFILLGTAQDPATEKEFLHIKRHYHLHPHLFMSLAFNETLSRQIYAAADALIIPSIFEPCGLTQMIAMRYGTVPIARKTGGLADTVFDLDDPTHKPTGFLFEEPTELAIHQVIDRAFTIYHNHFHKWRELISAGLSLNLGWDSSQIAYEKIYQEDSTHASRT